MSNNKSDSAETQFQNENANKTNLDFKEKRYHNIEEKNLEEKQSKIEQVISSIVELK